MSRETQSPPDPHRLRAMELRGGNDAASDWVSVSGFEAYVYAQPYQNAAVGGDLRFVSTCPLPHGDRPTRRRMEPAQGAGPVGGNGEVACPHRTHRRTGRAIFLVRGLT